MDNSGNRERSTIPTFVYVTSHSHSKVICSAFAEGSQLRKLSADKYVRGNSVVYGRLRGCNEIISQTKINGFNWYYIDRGYFRATRDTDYTGYFRITKNALQHNGFGTGSLERFQRLKIHIHDWRKSGNHILVCPPGKVFGELSNFNSEEWVNNIVSLLRKYTDREIRIRLKPSNTNKPVALGNDLHNCWALVTHSSNAAVEALILGIPVFCTNECASFNMGYSDISKIENPYYPEDRLRWAKILASNQWTLDEMKSGLAWKMLNEN